jgi:GT2 family glycosyltransferase
VTVVVMSRDRRERALSTLERLTSSSGAAEVVFVDNASSDGTTAAVHETFPAVRLIGLDHNRGAVARTIGVRAARTAYVAFSDDDSWWADGSLATAQALFDAHPSLALVMAKVLVGRGEEVDPACRTMAAGRLGHPPGMPQPRVLGFVACGAVVRREAFLGVGGFNGLVAFPGEEDVLALDLASQGWDLVYADTVVAHHDPQESADRDGRRAALVRSSLVTTWLRRPAPRALSVTLKTMRQCGDREVRSGVIGALRRLPAALGSRRPIPPAVEQQLRLLEA